MILDPEELQRRKQERLRRQKAQKKRQLLILAVAALVVIGLITGILLWIFSGDDKAPVSEGPHPDDTVIHLAAAGDLIVSDRVVESGTEDYDYTQTFLDVGYLLGKADISVINFEGNLAGAPYGSKYASAPNSMMEALDAAGVDLIQLANSYSIYNGMSGLSSTIDGVRAAGMEPLGVYASQSDYEKSGGYTLCQVKGIRIAFVAFTKGMDGMTLPAGAENCVNLLYTDYNSGYQQVNTQKIETILDNVQEENPDLIVAMVHWGSEFNDTISTSQNQICELLQKNGVDAIIGTHSHYVQSMVFDADKGSFVAYSLGDFYSEPSRAGSEYSVVLDLEITKSATNGKTKITGYSYTPIFRDDTAETLQLLRIREAMAAFEGEYINPVSQKAYAAMQYALERIEKRIAGS